MHNLNTAVESKGVRAVWKHKPTGYRWVVETDRYGRVVGAAGPFTTDDWDTRFRAHLMPSRRSAYYVRAHAAEFVLENA
jgi:hypothetical protein